MTGHPLDAIDADAPEPAPRQFASVEDLFAVDRPEPEDVQLPDGRWVTLRGLTRYELLLNGKGTDDSSLIEARNLNVCLLRPALTVEQAQRWQRTSTPNVIACLTDHIRRLSGLAEGAAKSRVHGDGERRS